MTQSPPFQGQPNAGPQQFNPQGQKKNNYKKNQDSPQKQGQRYEKKDKTGKKAEKKYSPKKPDPVVEAPVSPAKPEWTWADENVESDYWWHEIVENLIEKRARVDTLPYLSDRGDFDNLLI